VGSAKGLDSGKIKFSGQDAPAVLQQRIRTAHEFKKNRQGACIFKVLYVSLSIVNFTPPDEQATLQNHQYPGPKPAAKLPKPVDSIFDGLARLLVLCI